MLASPRKLKSEIQTRSCENLCPLHCWGLLSFICTADTRDDCTCFFKRNTWRFLISRNTKLGLIEPSQYFLLNNHKTMSNKRLLLMISLCKNLFENAIFLTDTSWQIALIRYRLAVRLYNYTSVSETNVWLIIIRNERFRWLNCYDKIYSKEIDWKR